MSVMRANFMHVRLDGEINVVVVKGNLLSLFIVASHQISDCP